MPTQRKAIIADRRHWVLTYAMCGLSIRQITSTLATNHDIHVSKTTVANDLNRVVAHLVDENRDAAERVRAMQMARYVRLLQTWFPLALMSPKTESTGDARLAVDTVLRVMDRIDRLHGVQQVNVDARSVNLTVSEQQVDVLELDVKSTTEILRGIRELGLQHTGGQMGTEVVSIHSAPSNSTAGVVPVAE